MHLDLGGALPPTTMPARICNGRENLNATQLFSLSWHKNLTVADNQQEGSCIGRGFAARLEMDILAVLGESWQLDAYAVWERGRQMYYRGDLNGGLSLMQGLNAILDLGIINGDSSSWQGIPLYAQAIHRALQQAALIQAHTAHDGWDPDRLDPDNGAVDESEAFTYGSNGHCTLGIGWNWHNGVPLIPSFNSWDYGYGQHGVFCMTWQHWLATALDNPILLLVDPDWWRTSKVWRKFIIAPGTQQAPR